MPKGMIEEKFRYSLFRFTVVRVTPRRQFCYRNSTPAIRLRKILAAGDAAAATRVRDPD